GTSSATRRTWSRRGDAPAPFRPEGARSPHLPASRRCRFGGSPFDLAMKTKRRAQRRGPVRQTTQKITPFLWFDSQAEEAVNFYVSIFKKSKITGLARYEEESAKASGRPRGPVMTVAAELKGQEFVALNGVPLFRSVHA